MKQRDNRNRLPLLWRMIVASLIVIFCFIMGVILLGNRKTVLVGYPLINGFQDINENGEFYGYNYEIIQRIAKESKWNVEYVVGTYDELYDRVKKGEIDVLGGVNDLGKNERNEVAFAQYANGSDRSVILSNSIRTYLNDYNALHLKKIGFLTNSRAFDEFSQLARNYNIQYHSLFYDTFDELMDAMNKKQVDAISFSSQYSFPLHLLIAEHHLSDYYFVTALNNTNVLRDINRALSLLQTQQPTLIQDLDQFYYHEMNTSAFSSETQTQKNVILHFALAFGMCLLLILFFYYIGQNAEQKLMKRDFLRAILNDRFSVSFIPIASYQNGTKQMFVLQYYCDCKKLGYVRKEDMIAIKGIILPVLFRIHEFRVVARSISELLQHSSYQNTKFIINLHFSYRSWWQIAQFSLLLRFCIKYYRIPPKVLLFSFSSTNVNDQQTKFSINKTCQKLGISFVMNDFGMQFSSLSQIKKIDYEYFKVDRIYTSDFTYNDLSLQIIKLIVNIAASLQKEVIIDGIDDEATYIRATSLGCHFMQGKYVGSPMALKELLDGK